jgi:hypothetical protein
MGLSAAEAIFAPARGGATVIVGATGAGGGSAGGGLTAFVRTASNGDGLGPFAAVANGEGAAAGALDGTI